MTPLTRRQFARRLVAVGGVLAAAPAPIRLWGQGPGILESGRPVVTHGVASGDVTEDSAIVWSRADRPARMLVEWSTVESMANVRKTAGDIANEGTGFTAKCALVGLPAGQRIFYRVRFESDDAKAVGEPVSGQFATAPDKARDVLFAWSGDTCGQGYGIDESRGGIVGYASMLKLKPDFFIHSGDVIYADNPVETERKLPNNAGVWKNLVTPEKAKVAETLHEYRGNYLYNLLDKNLRAFNTSVPMLVQWDDHEVRNNWYPGQRFADDRYEIKDIDTLFRRAQRAFFEFNPIRPDAENRIYRAIRRGPLCEVFMLDERTYRGPNTPNRQPIRSAETAFLGEAQLQWLKQALAASRATWKIVASDMPVGMVVGDGKNFENCANGNGPPLGRELEFAELLSHLKQVGVKNMVWLTADVHHAVSHYYHPDKAVFKEFDPFWEFVSGPLHAGTFGPGTLDNTFGPEVRWNSRKKGDRESGPFAKDQFFGTVAIEGKSKALTVTHYNRDGEKLWSTTLEPAGS